jgi:nickel transport protein
MRKLCLFFIVGVLVVTAATLDAHGIWFAERAGKLAIVYGEGPEDLEIVPRAAKVSGLAAYDAAGAAVTTKLIKTEYLLLVDTEKKPAVFTAVLDNGLWTTDASNQEFNKGKNEVPNAKDSGHYWKYAVHVRADLKAPLGALPGQRLQLTPVAVQLPKKKDESITLRALFDGKPLGNAAVLADFVNEPTAPTLRTAADGTITVKVRNHGLNVISVVHNTPTENPAQADKVQHRATLSFSLPL